MLFGIRRGRPAAPRLSIERRHRRRLRLAMGGFFPFIGAHEGSRHSPPGHRRMACHWNASRSLLPSHRAAALPRSLDGMLMECTLAATSAQQFATDLAVLYGLLCSHARVSLEPCRYAWSLEGTAVAVAVKNLIFLNSSPLSIPRCADSGAVRGFASFALLDNESWVTSQLGS